MSILYNSNEGWIISHLNYLYYIYKTVEDQNKNVVLKFNHILFNVNSQFLRHNQIESNNTTHLVGKKRKKLQILSQEILEQNNYVKMNSEKLLSVAKDLKIFMDVISDNNEASRLESKKFYLDRFESNHNYHGSNQRDVAIIAEFQNEKYVFPPNCQFYCYDIKTINEKYNVNNQFDLVLLDPPWWNKAIRRKKVNFKESSYNMMYNDEFAKIPIKNLLNSNGIVAVWCTNSASVENIILTKLFPAWGVVFKAKWYWLKITQNGQPICNYNESHGKQPYEQLIFGTVSSNLNFNIPDKKIIISIPSAVHSHKPPLAEIFNSYFPKKAKYMEIFARYLLPGWTSWGFEVLKFQHLSLYTSITNENTHEEDS